MSWTNWFLNSHKLLLMLIVLIMCREIKCWSLEGLMTTGRSPGISLGYQIPNDVPAITFSLTHNAQFPLWDVPDRNHGSCIHHPGLDICFGEYNYHDSLQVYLTEGVKSIFLSTFCHYKRPNKIEKRLPLKQTSQVDIVLNLWK